MTTRKRTDSTMTTRKRTDNTNNDLQTMKTEN